MEDRQGISESQNLVSLDLDQLEKPKRGKIIARK